MLIATKPLHGCSLEGPDGVLGTVKDLLFDGQHWKVRYLDVDTGGWLRHRRVILAPEVIERADYMNHRLGTQLTREQVENSPPLESHLPVSRKKEIEAAQYFAWDAYWANVEPATEETASEVDANLLSIRAVSGYRIETSDGKIGHVDDFIVDDEDLAGGPWEIRYLVVDTGHWLHGRQVLIAPQWAHAIDWSTQRVQIDMARETIENSPEFDPSTPINRQYEQVFHDYYGRAKYGDHMHGTTVTRG